MSRNANSPTSERSATGPRKYAGIAATVIVAATTFGAPARAESMDYGALEQLFGEAVTTSATGSPQRVAEVPANMEIITADDIRRSGADNIPDILQFVAGLDVRRYGFAQAEVSVRGYNQQFSPRLLVLINGRQVYLDVYGRTAWQSLPVQLDEIRQIEVVRGPNSALFGFNAVGGVINIITYDPLFDSTNSVTIRGGTQAYAGGSAVVTLHAGEDAGLRLSLGGSRAREFSTSSFPPELGPYNRSPYQLSFSADGSLRLGPNVNLTAEATATGTRHFDIPPYPRFANDSYRTNSFKLGLTADTRFGWLDLTAYRNDLHFVAELFAGRFAHDNEVYVVQASDLFKLDNDHTVRLGLEYRDNSVSGEVFGGEVGFSVYAASAMWSWEITPELALTNAVRFDHLTLRYNGTLVPGIRYTMADYNNATLGEFSFNSGLVYRPTPDDTVRVLVARGVQAPSLVDFGFQLNSKVGGLPLSFVGSPNLDATSVTNYEIDYDRNLLSINAVLRAAVYYQRTDSLVASPVNAPLAPGAGGLVGYAANVGSSRAAGGEIGLNGTTESGIRWNVSYAFISITDHLSIGPLSGSSRLLDYDSGTPASIVNLGAGYSWRQFDVDAQARWQSQFTDFLPSLTAGAEPFRVNNYITMNARIAYRISENLTLSLVGEQLTQPRIFEAAGTPVERRLIAAITGRF